MENSKILTNWITAILLDTTVFVYNEMGGKVLFFSINYT